MGHDDRRIRLALIEPGWLEDIRDDIRTQVSGLVADTLDRETLFVGITNHRRLFHRTRRTGLSRRPTISQPFRAYHGSAGNRDYCRTDEPAPPLIRNLIFFNIHNLRLKNYRQWLLSRSRRALTGAGTSRPRFRLYR